MKRIVHEQHVLHVTRIVHKQHVSHLRSAYCT